MGGVAPVNGRYWATTVHAKGMQGDTLVTSTKIMLLGMLIMLLGLALSSATAQFVEVRTIGFEAETSLAYGADALFVVGFIVGVIGLFFRN